MEHKFQRPTPDVERQIKENNWQRQRYHDRLVAEGKIKEEKPSGGNCLTTGIIGLIATGGGATALLTMDKWLPVLQNMIK